MRAAVIQMTSGPDVEANTRTAGRLVGDAAAAGAELVVLPEKWPLIHDAEPTLAAAESLDGASASAARGWARDHALTLLAGSIIEAAPDGRVHNTSLLIDPAGEVTARYRKLHMFDVEVAGTVYRESDASAPGDEVVAAPAAGRSLGMTICYDLRFPELYRRLALDGADLLGVPAAFTAATGRAHWETLLRARAIENQAFVLASDQWGEHPNGTRSHGGSMIVDPWGTVLARIDEGEGVAIAELDFAEMDAVRGRLPVLGHRRADVYGDPGPAR